MFSFFIISKSDVVIISTPPVFSAISTFFIAKLFRKKVILDVRDLWPESAIEVVQVKENILFKIIGYFVNIMYKYSNSVTVISQTMKNTIIDNYNIQYNKICVIHNFSNNKIFKGKIKSNNNIKIAYTGILTDAQDIYDILLKSYNNDSIEWHIAGSGDQFDKINRLIYDNNIKNIKMYGYQDKQFCDNLIEQSDIALVPLKYSKLFEMAIPSKFYEYLSFNKPILFNTSIELDSFNKEYDFGWYFDSRIDKSLENILNSIQKSDLPKKSENAKRLFNEKFEESIVCEKMYKLINEL